MDLWVFVFLYFNRKIFQVNNDSCGESRLRENLCFGNDAFSKKYFVYFKKKR